MRTISIHLYPCPVYMVEECEFLSRRYLSVGIENKKTFLNHIPNNMAMVEIWGIVVPFVRRRCLAARHQLWLLRQHSPTNTNIQHQRQHFFIGDRLEFQLSTDNPNSRHLQLIFFSLNYFLRILLNFGIYRFSGSASRPISCILALSIFVCDRKRGYGGYLDVFNFKKLKNNYWIID